MQFAVPQFTEVEDRLIARLTLKQFLVLLAAGGITLFFWSIFGLSFIFFVFAVPIAIAGIGLALGRYNGRPMFIYFMPFATFLTSNRVMIFKREEQISTIKKTDATEPAVSSQAEIANEPAESRLKKLAYLLDNKSEEESKIISTDFEKFVVKPKPAITETIKKISTVNTLSKPILQPADRHRVVPARTAPPAAPTPRKFDPNKIFNPNG